LLPDRQRRPEDDLRKLEGAADFVHRQARSDNLPSSITLALFHNYVTRWERRRRVSAVDTFT
jgi:hypothetical protein